MLSNDEFKSGIIRTYLSFTNTAQWTPQNG